MIQKYRRNSVVGGARAPVRAAAGSGLPALPERQRFNFNRPGE